MRIFYWFPLFLCSFITAQNIEYVKNICQTLSSKEYAGRGYTKYPNASVTGIEKARQFIISEIQKNKALDLNQYIIKSRHFSKKINFKKLPNNFQSDKIQFNFNNIYFSQLKVNGQTLILGKNYLPDPASPSIDFSGVLIKIDSNTYLNSTNKVIIKLEKKLMYSSSNHQNDYTLVYLNKNAISNNQNQINIELKIKSKVEKVNTQNIYGFIPGTQYPDSFIVFSAHYDHLGNIDTTYFPGANDNASGAAVLLDLMQYFQSHPLKYSVAFYFFTGEEIGLLGSEYYVKHPLFDLKRIKFLINLDLMGGGSEGIMVVNGKIFEKEFKILENVNEENKLNIPLKSRGKAQNSDHYWFSENHVKCFFIYTLGDITAYHDIYDKAQNLKFNNYHHLFHLITNFAQKVE